MFIYILTIVKPVRKMMDAAKKQTIKEIIRQLHEGADPEEMKRRFRDAIGDVSATDISVVEEELIREGMPRERIRKLCDVHLAVFRDSIEQQNDIAPEGHPVYVLMHEHSAMLDAAEELSQIASAMREEQRGPTTEELIRIRHLVALFRDAERHYLREENVLFPHLERHGVTQPPAIMWMEHDQIRAVKKMLFSAVTEDESGTHVDVERLDQAAIGLRELLSSHFYKENNILFPTALRLFTEDDWTAVRRDFAEIGLCDFSPRLQVPGAEDSASETQAGAETVPAATDGEVQFETGTLRREVLEAILNTLPVDITFVDAEDRVRYFSRPQERFFVRPKSVLGRHVQYCHPQKSLHMVNRILDDFKSGRRDVADFWIRIRGRLIMIRYFAVRSPDGEYLGTLEVSQDITDIKALEGEKRLLDDDADSGSPSAQPDTQT